MISKHIRIIFPAYMAFLFGLVAVLLIWMGAGEVLPFWLLLAVVFFFGLSKV